MNAQLVKAQQSTSRAGSRPTPEFGIGLKVSEQLLNRVNLVTELERIMNQHLSVSDYSENPLVQHIHFTFIILPNDGKGIPWDDHKTIRKIDNSLIIHIRFPDYEAVVNGTDEDAKKIMVQQLLRGANKYLPTVKKLNYKSLITDMTVLFQKNELL